MEILENFKTFRVKEKVGMLQPDVWVIHSNYKDTSGVLLYRVMYDSQRDVRPTGVVEHELLVKSIEDGVATLGGLKKFKKKDIDKGKK